MSQLPTNQQQQQPARQQGQRGGLPEPVQLGREYQRRGRLDQAPEHVRRLTEEYQRRGLLDAPGAPGAPEPSGSVPTPSHVRDRARPSPQPPDNQVREPAQDQDQQPDQPSAIGQQAGRARDFAQDAAGAVGQAQGPDPGRRATRGLAVMTRQGLDQIRGHAGDVQRGFQAVDQFGGDVARQVVGQVGDTAQRAYHAAFGRPEDETPNREQQVDEALVKRFRPAIEASQGERLRSFAERRRLEQADPDTPYWQAVGAATEQGAREITPTDDEVLAYLEETSDQETIDQLRSQVAGEIEFRQSPNEVIADLRQRGIQLAREQGVPEDQQEQWAEARLQASGLLDARDQMQQQRDEGIRRTGLTGLATEFGAGLARGGLRTVGAEPAAGINAMIARAMEDQDARDQAGVDPNPREGAFAQGERYWQDVGRSVEETFPMSRTDPGMGKFADPLWWAGMGGEQVPIFASLWAGGGAGLGAARTLGMTERSARLMQGLGAMGGVGAIDGAGAYNEGKQLLMEQGVPEDQASQRAMAPAAVAGLSSAILSNLPYGEFIARNRAATSRLTNAIRGAAVEGSSEAGQELSQLLALYGMDAKDPEAQDIWRLIDASVAGGAIGGVAGAAMPGDPSAQAAERALETGQPLDPEPDVEAGRDPDAAEPGPEPERPPEPDEESTPGRDLPIEPEPGLDEPNQTEPPAETTGRRDPNIIATPRQMRRWYEKQYGDHDHGPVIESMAEQVGERFRLAEVPISTVDPMVAQEGDIDQQRVSEISRLSEQERADMPPIIASYQRGETLDPSRPSLQVIDGAHRTEGLRQAGQDTIRAYVPESAAATIDDLGRGDAEAVGPADQVGPPPEGQQPAEVEPVADEPGDGPPQPTQPDADVEPISDVDAITATDRVMEDQAEVDQLTDEQAEQVGQVLQQRYQQAEEAGDPDTAEQISAALDALDRRQPTDTTQPTQAEPEPEPTQPTDQPAEQAERQEVDPDEADPMGALPDQPSQATLERIREAETRDPGTVQIARQGQRAFVVGDRAATLADDPEIGEMVERADFNGTQAVRMGDVEAEQVARALEERGESVQIHDDPDYDARMASVADVERRREARDMAEERLDPVDFGVWTRLHSTAGAVDRWADRRLEGMNNTQLRDAINQEMGTGGNTMPQGFAETTTLKGRQLVEAARRAIEMPTREQVQRPDQPQETEPDPTQPPEPETPQRAEPMRLEPAAQHSAGTTTPADVLRTEDGTRPQTGQPIVARLYRGSGRQDWTEVYGPGATGPILGEGSYYAISEDDARTFGPDVEAREVSLSNPLVIETRDQLQDWMAEGRTIPRDNQGRSELIEGFRRRVREAGHDGVIVQVPFTGDVAPDGSNVKQLREVFGHTQVFTFEQPAQAAEPATEGDEAAQRRRRLTQATEALKRHVGARGGETAGEAIRRQVQGWFEGEQKPEWAQGTAENRPFGTVTQSGNQAERRAQQLTRDTGRTHGVVYWTDAQDRPAGFFVIQAPEGMAADAGYNDPAYFTLSSAIEQAREGASLFLPEPPARGTEPEPEPEPAETAPEPPNRSILRRADQDALSVIDRNVPKEAGVQIVEQRPTDAIDAPLGSAEPGQWSLTLESVAARWTQLKAQLRRHTALYGEGRVEQHVAIFADQDQRGRDTYRIELYARPIPRTDREQRLQQQRDRLLERYRKEYQEARTDPLTGAGTRRLLEENQDRMRQAADATGQPMSVLAWDLGNFKALNDTLGHAAGDRALQRFAKVLHDNVRHRDARNEGRPLDAPGVVARPGGDEFIVMLPGTDEAGAHVVRDRIESAFGSEAIGDTGRTMFATGGVGVYQPNSGEAMDSVMGRADSDLYDRKMAQKQERGEPMGRDEQPLPDDAPPPEPEADQTGAGTAPENLPEPPDSMYPPESLVIEAMRMKQQQVGMDTVVLAEHQNSVWAFGQHDVDAIRKTGHSQQNHFQVNNEPAVALSLSQRDTIMQMLGGIGFETVSLERPEPSGGARDEPDEPRPVREVGSQHTEMLRRGFTYVGSFQTTRNAARDTTRTIADQMGLGANTDLVIAPAADKWVGMMKRSETNGETPQTNRESQTPDPTGERLEGTQTEGDSNVPLGPPAPFGLSIKLGDEDVWISRADVDPTDPDTAQLIVDASQRKGAVSRKTGADYKKIIKAKETLRDQRVAEEGAEVFEDDQGGRYWIDNEETIEQRQHLPKALKDKLKAKVKKIREDWQKALKAKPNRLLPLEQQRRRPRPQPSKPTKAGNLNKLRQRIGKITSESRLVTMGVRVDRGGNRMWALSDHQAFILNDPNQTLGREGHWKLTKAGSLGGAVELKNSSQKVNIDQMAEGYDSTRNLTEDIDVVEFWRHARRASIMRPDGVPQSPGVLFLNPDNSVGFAYGHAMTGSAELNVQDNAQELGLFDPDLLMDVLGLHYAAGFDRVNLWIKDAKSALRLRSRDAEGREATSLLMAMSGENTYGHSGLSLSQIRQMEPHAELRSPGFTIRRESNRAMSVIDPMGQRVETFEDEDAAYARREELNRERYGGRAQVEAQATAARTGGGVQGSPPRGDALPEGHSEPNAAQPTETSGSYIADLNPFDDEAGRFRRDRRDTPGRIARNIQAYRRAERDGQAAANDSVYHVISDLARRFNLGPPGIANARLLKKWAAGFYRVKPPVEAIRLADASRVTTYIHELGHHLHKVLFQRAKNPKKEGEEAAPHRVDFPPEWRDELVQLGKDLYGDRQPVGGYTSEGWAETVRFLVSNPNHLKQRAPRVYHDVVSQLAREHPEIWASLLEARIRLLHIAKHAETNPVRQFIERNRRWRTNMKALWDGFRAAWFDRNQRAVTMLEDLGLQDLPADQNPHTRALRTTGVASGHIQHMMHEGRFDPATGEKIGPGLREILDPVRDPATLELWEDYMVAQRALEKRAQGFTNVLRQKDLPSELTSDAGLKRFIDRVEQANPQFREVADEFQAFNEWLVRDYAVHHDLISADVAELIISKNLHYLTFRHMKTEDALDAVPSRAGYRKGMTGQKAGLGRFREGLNEPLHPPLASFLNNMHGIVSRAQNNATARSFTDLWSSGVHGVGRWIDKIDRPVEGMQIKAEQLNDFLLKQMGLGLRSDGEIVIPEYLQDLTDEQMDGLLETLQGLQDQVFFKPGMRVDRDTRQVTVLQEGKPLWYEVKDSRLFDLLEGLGNPTATDAWVKWLTLPRNLLRMGATQLNPEFFLVNFVRDITQAISYSERDLRQLPQDAQARLRGMKEAFTGGDIYRLFLLSGGNMSGMFQEYMTPKGLIDYRELFGESRAYGLLRGRKVSEQAYDLLTLGPLQRLNNAVELTNRLSEFEARRQGRRDMRSIKEAGQAAADITLDYTRGGRIGMQVNRGVVFFNAAMQGNDRFGRFVKDHPIRAVGRIFSLIVMPSMLSMALLRDDEDYWARPKRDRDRHWFFPTGHDENGNPTYLRISKPYVLGLFGTVAERLTARLYGIDPETGERGDPRAFDGAALAAVNELKPPYSVAGLMPLLEVNAGEQGYSFFFDRSIVSESDKDLPYAERGASYSTQTAAWLGKMANIAPAKIDYLIRGWFGGMGNTITETVTDPVIGTIDPAVKQQQEPVDFTDYLVIRRFLARAPKTSHESMQRFWDDFDKLQRVHRGLNAREEQPEAYDEYYNRHQAALELYQVYLPVRQQLSENYRELRRIWSDPNIPGDEADQQASRIIERMIQATQEVHMIRRDEFGAERLPEPGQMRRRQREQ